MPGLSHYLVVSALLFFLGLAGFISRKNIFIMFLSVELMLNGINLSFVAFSRHLQDMSGHVFVFFVIAVAAAEAAISLALVILLYKNRQSIDVDEFKIMKG
ncbi:MAG: NADH-quinone oxidoreductase subunit NuoK [Candidatus Melainabacteria bacterium HGW-Melainabacteria-1]|nr:MAG: NADH-quinone oxidoreductase subunit NuoK [Candidatus Melainabacteria bacterium HGW-Melainabacteria-1]